MSSPLPHPDARIGRASRAAPTALHTAVLVGALGATLLSACGDDAGQCPDQTEPLSAAEVDISRQLEVCASRVTGTTLRRDDLPQVESRPTLVQCDQTAATNCVATPAGEPVAGYYLEGCDTFTVGSRAVLLHEMLHPVLCDAPDVGCDGGHRNAAWTECQQFKGCPDGGIILIELVCNGTPDCAQGEDELGCD